MLRDTILTFHHGQFGMIRAVRFKNEPYIVVDDLLLALAMDLDDAELIECVSAGNCCHDTLPWVKGQPLNLNHQMLFVNREGAFELAWCSPARHAHRVALWLRDVVFPLVEFLSREESRFGALDVSFCPADVWKLHGLDPSFTQLFGGRE